MAARVGAFLTALYNDPALRAYGRLGWKELGNVFDPSRDGSITQTMHEYGMPFSGTTPGEVAAQKKVQLESAGFEEENLLAQSRAAAGPGPEVESPTQGRDR